MIARILEIKEEGDTCGGIVEIIAEGVPPGLGEPVFNKLSADLAAGLMSIGSVKGVEFGAGFAATKMKGSEHNDIPYLDGNKIRFRTNNAGGLLGGISNGENLVARIAVKPTSTISKDQWTVNMAEMKEQILAAITRRDPTICARIVPVAESMVALTLMDHLMMWRGWQGVARLDNPWLAAWEEQEA
jgi:chorismate synthase